MDSLLNSRITDLLAAERRLLSRLRTLLERAGAADKTLEHLSNLLDNLDELFLVVVVGEFNAGKSSVLNALFGEKVLEEGPIPTTAKITVLRYGREPLLRQRSEFLVEYRYPMDLLRHVHLVDTPGTNSIIQQHQKITEDFIPRADLVLFVTSYDRPLTESEKQFLEFIRGAWGKRLVFVLNKADLARDEQMLGQVLEHIRSGCEELMDFEPEIFPISAELAYEAKNTQDEEEREKLWERSRFAGLEQLITKTLTGPERLAIKLQAPLDAGDRLLGVLDSRLEERTALLAEDERSLERLRELVDEERGRLREGYGRQLAEIDNLLLVMEQRGIQFLRDNIRISKMKLLRDRDQFKEEFMRQVVRDTDRLIESRVTEAVDVLLKNVISLWNRILDAFTTRLRVADQQWSSPQRGAFDYNRTDIFGSIMREAERRTRTHDLQAEARRILENARDAAAFFVGTEALAAGIGVLSAVLVAATALDVTGGFIASGVLAAAGLVFLPRQKHKAISEFKERVESLRQEMKQALAEQFDQEIEDALTKVRETVEPYKTYVEREQGVLGDIARERDHLREDVEEIRAEVRAETRPAGADA